MMETQTKESQNDLIFRSKLPDINISNHLSLHSYCFENISTFNTKPCLINGTNSQVYTYAEVELISRKVANGFHKLGIKQGDTIMILLPNIPEFFFAIFGASYIGAISTPANPLYTTTSIINQALETNTKLIITESNNFEKLQQFSKENDVKILCVDDTPLLEDCLSFSELYRGESICDLEGPIINPDDVAIVLYTSGTTGKQKGVMLSHKGVVTSVAQQVDGENPCMHISSDDVLMCAMPLFHIFAFYFTLCGFRVGASNLLMQEFNIDQYLELIPKHKVTVCPIVPPVVLAIAKSPVIDKYDLSTIRMVISGAAPLGKELEDVVRAKFPNAILGQAYGMTEAGPVISICLTLAKEPLQMKPGSCGSVVRNASMKIIDQVTGVSLPRNKPGEILIRGDQILKGYLNNQEGKDKDGWLHTGDVGYIDDDDELFVVDRAQELITYKGYLVSAAELEDLLLMHPQITDAAVVAMTDEVAGEVPIAFVVKSSGSIITEDDIKQYVSTRVDFYKRINTVMFVDSIPKTPSGKILRRDLKARLGDGKSDEAQRPNGVDESKDLKENTLVVDEKVVEN